MRFPPGRRNLHHPPRPPLHPHPSHLQAFLSHPDAGKLLAAQGRSDGMPVHLALLPTFATHAVDGTLHGKQQQQRHAAAAASGYSETLQRVALRSRALANVFAAGAGLFGAAAGWPAAAAGRAPLLAGVHVLLRWLAAQPAYAVVGSTHRRRGQQGLRWFVCGSLACRECQYHRMYTLQSPDGNTA